MSRFVDSLTRQLTAVLGEGWTVESPRGWNAVIATHANGSRTRAFFEGEDGRRYAHENETAHYMDKLRRFLASELPKYTPEWAEKGRAALADIPEVAWP